jgi:hypothetical protein
MMAFWDVPPQCTFHGKAAWYENVVVKIHAARHLVASVGGGVRVSALKIKPRGINPGGPDKQNHAKNRETEDAAAGHQFIGPMARIRALSLRAELT